MGTNNNSSEQPFLARKAYADLTGYDTAAAFTVTGDVLVQVCGVVGGTAITSTSGTTTLSVGHSGSTEALIANTTIDNIQFTANVVWVDTSPGDQMEAQEESGWFVVGGGADIQLTRDVDDITAGALTLYCWWRPLSAGATVVAT